MKKSISIIVIVAMLLSTVLAIIPMSAAAETEVEARKNVLFSNEDAANYQFMGNGNVFYYDYHYYMDVVGTFKISDTGPSLRVGNNSGSGTASATDGKPFAGSMNHSYSDDCATLTTVDGATVTHDHVFGYSFKEAVTIDGFKLFASANKSSRDNINKVTIYGASVDPEKKYDSYKAGQYYYSVVTELYSTGDADVQATTETEGDVTAAVVSGDFDAATVDYILIAVDFNQITDKKYCVYEVEAYGALASDYEEDVEEEEEEEVAIDDLLPFVENSVVDWSALTYKSLFAGAESAEKFDEVYNVVIDGSTLTTSAKDTTNNDKGYNLGYVAQTEYAITADSYYVYEFTAKLFRDTGYAGVVFAANGNDHYFAGGAFANDGDHDDDEGNQASHIVLYKNEWNQNFNKQFGDHTAVPNLEVDGFGTWRIVYEGLTVKVQYVAKDGTWTYITDDEGNVCSIELPEGCFVAVGAHNRGGAKGKDRTIVIKDAKIHDLNTPSLDALMKLAAETEIDWANLTYDSYYKGEKVTDSRNFLDYFDLIINGNDFNTANKETSKEVGYVSDTGIVLTEDSHYVYEFKAKLNKSTGYCGPVFALSENTHYFMYGGFANDGDYFAAIEDAIWLGCDSVNLSLGSGSPGSS